MEKVSNRVGGDISCLEVYINTEFRTSVGRLLHRKTDGGKNHCTVFSCVKYGTAKAILCSLKAVVV